MAAKSILEIEVNDQSFQNFMEKFKEYEKLLGGLADEWKTIGVAIGGAGATGAVAMRGTGASIEAATVLQHRLARATHSTASAMGTVAARAKEAAGYFANMAKLTALGAIGLGGAGLFGMDRLAHAVFGQRRTALGLGVSTGEQAAFRTNFGQFVDPDSLLGNVANARNDLSKQYAFRALGIGAGQEADEDNADLSADVMRRARQMWRRGPQTTQFAQAMGLSEFFSMEDLRRLGAMSDADAARADSGFSRDRTGMTVPDDVQRQWVQFSTQLRRAGIRIEATFVRGLAPLTPGLEHLSEGLTHVVEAFLGSKGIKTAIDNLGQWLDSPKLKTALQEFGDYLGSPKFTQDLRNLGDDIGMLAQKVAAGLRWFGMIPSHESGGPQTPESVHEAGGKPSTAMSDYSSFQDWKAHNIGFQSSIDTIRNTIAGNAAQYGVPPDLMWNLFGAETSFGNGSMVSPSGAEGWFQFMPSTAKDRGVDPWDAKSSTIGAMSYMQQLNKKYGDWRKSVAAYNWGEKHLDEDIAAHGKEWEKFSPPETQQELARVFPGGAGGGSDLSRAMDRLRRQMASRTTQPQVQVNVSSDVAARVALSGVQAAY